ncbi:MAG: hypothetical protein CVU46_08530 [Chloroflexi bacterium HGW-Chloroflexi-8]|jgi:hypothetical protein|nr:MAG: hypothetical protein CVU46_08530 [Chloroflexi bacterium HGW-Chloroflexi-8]
MKKQEAPIVSIVLYVLSGLNFIVMLICVFAAINADITIRSNAPLFQAILGTLGDIFLGYLARALRDISLIFTLVNAGISVLLFTAARLLKNSNRLSYRVQILEKKLEIASLK